FSEIESAAFGIFLTERYCVTVTMSVGAWLGVDVRGSWPLPCIAGAHDSTQAHSSPGSADDCLAHARGVVGSAHGCVDERTRCSRGACQALRLRRVSAGAAGGRRYPARAGSCAR